MIDFVANGVQVIETEIHNRITDICDLVHFLQIFHDQITHNTGGNFGFAHFLQLRFNLPYHALDIRRGDRSLRARDANAARHLLAVKLFAGAILLYDQRSRQYRALVRAEALSAIETLTPPADSAVGIVRSVEYFRVVMLAVRAPHGFVESLQN